jgi:hypothetical protein
VVRQARKSTEEATKAGLSGKGSTIEDATKLSLQSSSGKERRTEEAIKRPSE